MMLCGNRPVRTHSQIAVPIPTLEKSPSSTLSQQQSKAQRQAAARLAAAKSKNKLWGPSHSFDSDDDDVFNDHDSVGSILGAAPRPPVGAGWWENLNKAWVELGSLTMSAMDSGPVHKFGNNNNNSSGGIKAMQVLAEVKEEEEEEHGEESTDPSTQEEDSNEPQQQQPHRVNQSFVTHDSRSGAAHHPALNESTVSSTTRHDVSTSRDGTTAEWSRSDANRSSGTDPSGAKTSYSSCTRETVSTLNHNINSKNNKNDSNNNNNNNSICLEDATYQVERKVEEWTDLFSNACGTTSPCSAQDLEELFGRERTKTKHLNAQNKETNNLGIAPLQLDEEDDILFKNNSSRTKAAPQKQQQQLLEQSLSEESPADRRRQRAKVRRERFEKVSASISRSTNTTAALMPHEDFEVTSQQQVLVTQPTTTSILQAQSQLPPPCDTQDVVVSATPCPVPLETLLVKEVDAQALERNISELTMRSSYQEVKPSSNPNANNDQRRMAYYAVGRHHRLTSGPRSGGNRRCYFTGKIIFGGGSPFYAGIVQQGLKTLVVFCLPSALGMPHSLPNYKHNQSLRRPSASLSQMGSSFTSGRTGGLLQRSRRTLSSAQSVSLSKSPSKLSSTINLDDMSLSIEGDIDPNWNLDKDFLLRILPEADEALLAEMNKRYPEQFETLPVQVRHVSCWRLFVKFCFFSGLPIAEGELHYQVITKLALEMYGEDIVLSHEIMEAANGASSADILTLPNRKTFRYLKKHYQQQAAKLPEVIFQRSNWEQVKAEV